MVRSIFPLFARLQTYARLSLGPRFLARIFVHTATNHQRRERIARWRQLLGVALGTGGGTAVASGEPELWEWRSVRLAVQPPELRLVEPLATAQPPERPSTEAPQLAKPAIPNHR
jgi:hypothetical protein